ncbi:MAG: DoxX family protein [Gammaproteobacteria bacterium]|uniref:DoxX family protein n=1 Tax=Vreelandella venusta TaxID=44935 RepID=UPI0022867D7F|nr:DoxX family protein [Halomonas venusta]MBR9924607.1 DoxX family protein [Gammaproteobacteria bacterium]WAM55840.1 DoxX family protein [Halomonas venusta]
MTTTNTSPLALHATALLRISLGVMVLAHGLLKVFVFTLPGTVSYFESLGLPGVLAYLTIAAEVGGGLALLLGLYTRWVSLALVPVLLGAASVHLGNGWLFSNPGGGWEFPIFWTIALVVQAGLGGGSAVVSRKFA